MNKNSTTINLVLYLYNETQLTESVITQNTIDYDLEVNEEFRQLVFVKNLLDGATISASVNAIERIKSYSILTSTKIH